MRADSPAAVSSRQLIILKTSQRKRALARGHAIYGRKKYR